MQTRYFRVGDKVNTPAQFDGDWPIEGVVIRTTTRAVHVLVKGVTKAYAPGKLSHAVW